MNAMTAPQSISERVQALQAEARKLADTHSADLAAEILALRITAEAIAQGGDAYRPGVREIARRLFDNMANELQALESLMGRPR